MATPVAPAITATVNAWCGLIACRTRTRVRVRDICASRGGSIHWLKLLAAATQRPVPKVVQHRIERSAAPGATAYPAMVVSTTKADSLALVRSRYTVQVNFGARLHRRDSVPGIDVSLSVSSFDATLVTILDGIAAVRDSGEMGVATGVDPGDEGLL
ncbi:hypothetical protein HDU76_000464 [Blyttiomyces sp. JEL0837]|nr:hypothetical protein HDU76_000464 [Blyttiomyces sp. JEL0837]